MTTLNTQVTAKEFSHLSTLFFNSAYFGPSPLRARAYVQKALEREMDPSGFPYREWYELSDQVRAQIARLLGCHTDEVALSTSVSEIVSHVVNGLTYQPGDCVVTMQGDYPSNILPWMLNEKRLGYRLHKLDESVFESAGSLVEALPPQTRLVDLSLVRFDTGCRLNIVELGEALQQRGILFLVDASQCIGARTLTPDELRVCDIVASVSYKWMLGPYGHAFARFSKRALQQVQRTHAHWLASPRSVDSGNLVQYTTEALPGARGFDRGQVPNMLATALLQGSLDLFEELGMEAIWQHNQSLVHTFLELIDRKRVEIMQPAGLSSIICLRVKDLSAADLEARLRQNSIDASSREGNLRLSFHLFNTVEEVEKLVKTLVA